MLEEISKSKAITNESDKLKILRDDDGIVVGALKKGEKYYKRTAKQIKASRDFFSRGIIDDGFVKRMNKAKKVRELLKDSPMTFMALDCLLDHLKKDENTVRVPNESGIGDRPYTAADLAEDMQIKKQMAELHLTKLCKLRIIAKLKIDGNKFICVNPYYYGNGKSFPKIVIDLFNKQSEEQ